MSPVVSEGFLGLGFSEEVLHLKKKVVHLPHELESKLLKRWFYRGLYGWLSKLWSLSGYPKK